MKSGWSLAMVTAAALLIPATVRGQAFSATGSLYGTALDSQGNVLVGATATLTGPGAPQETQSDGRGDFHFLSLSPGEYVVELVLPGFESVRRSVTVSPGKNAVLSLMLPVAGAEEAITVRDEGVTFDNREVVTGATFGRRRSSSRSRPCGIRGGSFSRSGCALSRRERRRFRRGPRPIFVGKGSRPDQNSYELDGVPLSLGAVPPFFFDFDSLSNIDVATGGADPRPGDSRGHAQPRHQARHQRCFEARPAPWTRAEWDGTTESRRAVRSGGTGSGCGPPSRTTTI